MSNITPGTTMELDGVVADIKEGVNSNTEDSQSNECSMDNSPSPKAQHDIILLTKNKDDLGNIPSSSGTERIMVPAEMKTTTTTTAEHEETTKSSQSSRSKRRFFQWLSNFIDTNSFLIGVIVAILLAYAYPPLGAVYLQPQITATWIAVVFVFVLAGISLKTEEFKNAFKQVRFNAFVQVYNFGIVSGIVYGCSRFLLAVNALSQALSDGMVICASLPMTINMMVVLTKSSGGDEAAAVFNAAFGNMIGIFLTPLLVLGYLGTKGEINVGAVFFKLTLKVVVPIVFGQVLRKTCPPVVQFVTKSHKKLCKKLQELALVFIVYTVFCKTFLGGVRNAPAAFLMVGVTLVVLLVVMGFAWILLGLFFPTDVRLRVCGLFGCTHKSVATGIPMITALFEGSPNVGLYTLPLLIWHPMQLFLGTFLAPKLARYVEKEEERLAATAAEQQEGNKKEEKDCGKTEEFDLEDDEEMASSPAACIMDS